MAMWGEAVGLFPGIHLPNPVGAVGVAARTAEQRRPEHESLYFLTAGFLDPLIADLANEHRHFRACGQGTIHGFDRVRHTPTIAVAGLEHVKIENRRIIYAFSRATRWVNRDGMLVRIDGAHIAGQLGQATLLHFSVLFGRLRKIVGHCALARQTPNDWISAPPGDQVTP